MLAEDDISNGNLEFKTKMTDRKDLPNTVEFLASQMLPMLPNYLNNCSIASFGQMRSRICATDAFPMVLQWYSFMLCICIIHFIPVNSTKILIHEDLSV